MAQDYLQMQHSGLVSGTAMPVEMGINRLQLTWKNNVEDFPLPKHFSGFAPDLHRHSEGNCRTHLIFLGMLGQSLVEVR